MNYLEYETEVEVEVLERVRDLKSFAVALDAASYPNIYRPYLSENMLISVSWPGKGSPSPVPFIQTGAKVCCVEDLSVSDYAALLGIDNYNLRPKDKDAILTKFSKEIDYLVPKGAPHVMLVDLLPNLFITNDGIKFDVFEELKLTRQHLKLITMIAREGTNRVCTDLTQEMEKVLMPTQFASLNVFSLARARSLLEATQSNFMNLASPQSCVVLDAIVDLLTDVVAK